MKKIYIKPVCIVYEVEESKMIAMSVGEDEKNGSWAESRNNYSEDTPITTNPSYNIWNEKW